MEVYDTFEYGIDLTSNGTMYAAGGEGKTKKYLNAVLYDHIVSMTLPCIGKYKIGYNDGENPEIVAKNTIIKLGISPCTDVGANLVIAIKKAIMAEIPSLSSSSSSSSSSASSSALQSSSPDSLPPIFNNVSKSPFDDVLCLTGPQPDPEEHDSPLSIRKYKNETIQCSVMFLIFLQHTSILVILESTRTSLLCSKNIWRAAVPMDPKGCAQTVKQSTM